MAYKNILVLADGSPAGRRRVAAAVDLAKRFQSVLTGVFLRSAPSRTLAMAEPVGPIPSALLQGMLDDGARRADHACDEARTVFDAERAGSDIATHWLEIDGDKDDALVACVKRHDLAILPNDMSATQGRHVIAAGRVGMASGGPLLVLKAGGWPAGFGKKILIAWNDSRESARALHDALPFLVNAQEIHILRIMEDPVHDRDLLLDRLLKLHGCGVAHYRTAGSGETPIEDVIRLHVGASSADMVVMGLYGHSRMQEMIFGGVTRSLLIDPPMPLFVSH